MLDLVTVPDELLAGLDPRQRLRLACCLIDTCFENRHGLEHLLDEPTRQTADTVLAWLEGQRHLRGGLSGRAHTERIIVAAAMVAADAVGWCTRDEIIDQFIATRDVRAVLRMLGDRHLSAAGWAEQAGD